MVFKQQFELVMNIVIVDIYFSNKVVAWSEGLQSPGDIQWQLALCLLLCWVIVYLCLLRGINYSGKVCINVLTRE